MQSHYLSLRSLGILLLAYAIPSTSTHGLEVPVADDAQVIQGATLSGYNYGIAPNLAVYSTANAQRYTYVRFAPEQYLPPGYTSDDVVEALLVFYPNTVTTAGSFTVHSVTSTWTEGKVNGAVSSGTISWSNRPSDNAASQGTVSIAATDRDEFVATLDLTALVKNWIDTPAQNFGLMFKPSGSVVVVIDAKENADTAHGPRLLLTLAKKRVPARGDVSMGTFTNGPQP